MQRGGYTYIMTNKTKTTLYVGVTSNLENRIYEHKNHLFKNSFTDKYNIEFCVYYESFNTIEEAIIREKQIKGLTRAKKEILINSMNPNWEEIEL
ncbi:MAG: GIY-YIG nuclease family protein [Paludibacteraceae bacterium]|nr:GIY-YIG nuclease family protein [Paludibacteraceae bacterium]